MTILRACEVGQYDAGTDTCAQEVWIQQPGVLPPLPAAQGLQLSGLMIAIVATCWAFRHVRLFLSPKAG